MNDYFLRLRKSFKAFSYLLIRKSRLKGVGTTKQNILVATILATAASLFFSALFDRSVYADQFSENRKELSMETLDPMNRIGNGFISKAFLNEEGSQLALLIEEDSLSTQEAEREAAIAEMVAGHPMSEMVSYVAKRDSEVAAFLVAIAKKESNWGKHSPKKNGQECYNYWGYKGGYNVTASGYSCFDSAEQAIAVVGDRIENLIEKNIDTPEKFLVWKCGSTCAGHDPAGVKSWVATVRMYWQKLT